MTLKQVRYYFEHRLLPEWLYTEKEKLILTFANEQQKVPFLVMSDLCQREGLEMPYPEEDYQFTLYPVAENVLGGVLTLPEPEEEPLCYRVYFVFNKEFDRLAYYTLEKGQEEEYFLCGWDAEKTHSNYGSVDLDEEQIRAKIRKLYLAE